MKISRYKKISKNKYKLYFEDGKTINIFDDIILKYKLLLKKEIDEETYKNIVKDNNNYMAYDLALTYINIRVRCEKEIVEYLKKKEIHDNLIKETINKLKKNGFLNEKEYIRSFSNDKFNLSNYGPNKIKKELKSLGLNTELIEELVNFTKEEILEKLEKLIDKKIKQNKNYSGNVLRNRLTTYFYNLGFNKSDIDAVLNNKDLTNEDQYQKEYNKLLKKYERKYSGYELEQIIKQKLYLKGFTK